MFRFSSSLPMMTSVTFIACIESHWSLHSIYVAVVLEDNLRRHLANTEIPEAYIVDSVFIICAAVILALIVLVLAVQFRRAS